MSSTSRIIFSCPSCDAPLRGYAQQVGRQVRCPACSQSVVVPKSAKPSAEGEDWWAIDLPEGAVDVAPSLAKAPASTTARPPSTAPPSTAPPSSPPAKTNSTPNVDLRVRCDKCKTMLRVEAKVLGKKIRCPKCESVFVAGDEKPRTTAPVIDPNDFQFAPDPPAPTNTRGAKFDDTDPHAWLAANGFSLGEQTLDDLPDGSHLPAIDLR